jgi:selenide,water dikinase
LDSVLSRLPKQSDPNVLVGFDTSDDAGVYQLPSNLAPNLALVQTVDFFTPIVDDPFTFGQIAAVNALSDIYAMGGRPISALSIVCYPNDGKDVVTLQRILEGGLAKMEEAECTMIGGHSIGDDEIKFGYAVTGLIDPSRIWANCTVQAGDHLILTKPLGTGIIGTAIKKGRAGAEARQAATASMLQLNRIAAETAQEFTVHAVTDVTGFGLLGHAREMAVGSGVSLVLQATQVKLLPEALALAGEGYIPGGLKRNIEFAGSCVEFAPEIPEPLRHLLYDPQTAGGLLLSVPSTEASSLVRKLRGANIPACEMGRAIERTTPLIRVM